MKYIIYEIVEPNQLKYIDDSIYSPRTKRVQCLEELDIPSEQSEHDSYESAVKAIEENKDTFFKSMKLTILPVFDIDWEGDIR